MNALDNTTFLSASCPETWQGHISPMFQGMPGTPPQHRPVAGYD